MRGQRRSSVEEPDPVLGQEAGIDPVALGIRMIVVEEDPAVVGRLRGPRRERALDQLEES